MERDRFVTMSEQKSVRFFFPGTRGCDTPETTAL
jgi:hypothetical protein